MNTAKASELSCERETCGRGRRRTIWGTSVWGASVGVGMVVLTMLLVFGCSSSPSEVASDTPSPSEAPLRVVSAPNPNSYPIFVMGEGNMPENITFVPVADLAELTAVMNGNHADVMGVFSGTGAQLYAEGKLTNIKIWNVNVWRALYLVASSDIKSLDDLRGKTVYSSFKNGAVDLTSQMALRQHGYEPNRDVTIIYQPQPQVQQLFLQGKAEAAVFIEPRATMTLRQAEEMGHSAHILLDIQQHVASDMQAWAKDELPLGSLFVKNEILEDPAKRKAFLAFVEEYAAACDFIMMHPDEAAQMIAQGFERTYGGRLSASVLAESIRKRHLVFASRPIDGQLRTDFETFLSSMMGYTVDDAFYGITSAD